MLIIAWHVTLVKSFCLVNRKKCSAQVISFDMHNEPISRTVAVGSTIDIVFCVIQIANLSCYQSLWWWMKWSEWSRDFPWELNDSSLFVNKDRKLINLLVDINDINYTNFMWVHFFSEVEFLCSDSLCLCTFATSGSFMTYTEYIPIQKTS